MQEDAELRPQPIPSPQGVELRLEALRIALPLVQMMYPDSRNEALAARATTRIADILLEWVVKT